MATTVVNKRFPEYEVYIGRNFSAPMHFGNPFSYIGCTLASTKVASRQEAVASFKEWLEGTNFHDVEPLRRQWILDNVHILKDKVLGCFCKPLECHGDVLAEMADQSALGHNS